MTHNANENNDDDYCFIVIFFLIVDVHLKYAMRVCLINNNNSIVLYNGYP